MMHPKSEKVPTDMTLVELRGKLEKMRPGQMAVIHHDAYADLFPPGEPDTNAREACYKFAKSLGCRIESKPEQQMVWFVKD
jgi:hypothetical protein